MQSPLGDDNCGHIRQVAAGEGEGIKGDHCIAYYMYMLWKLSCWSSTCHDYQLDRSVCNNARQ